ncbi:MAG TPA: hypothetical protein VOA64_13180 [Candidatus Dormibacteraeota bacterium]|nr:hypothetical protein [Candidatus Dormibacteraeota bacterium]
MRRISLYLISTLALLSSPAAVVSQTSKQKVLKPVFQTSDRCLACHNGLTTPSGKDVSIGFDWRSGMMANSARDPYWQASVRREIVDHPESQAAIQDVCATCHMPIARYEAKVQGRLGSVFAHLPFGRDPQKNAAAEDGVTCSVCHQITKEKLGTSESFTGGFVVATPQSKDGHPEYGPYEIQNGQAHIMQTSTEGFRPGKDDHIQDSALCATCHTLYTKALAPGGKEIGLFPEQVPYLEWLHSDYPRKDSCQSCHMPGVQEDAPISAVLGVLRPGVRQHTFVGANFFMLKVLNLHRDDLSVAAMPHELTAEAQRTTEFLKEKSARVTIRNVDVVSSQLQVDVFVENLTGHKLPTAYPSRRAWLHMVVRDRNGRTVFESGALNSDGSIQGNDNDADPSRFELHYREIKSSDEVQIYEPILKDHAGHVTTGLSAAVGYLKDNRLLPSGFEKRTADKDIAVVGDAADDPNFTDAGDLVRYSISLGDAQGPFHVEVELWYQPIGFRWAHNLRPYDAMETHRFVSYYDARPADTAIVLAQTSATR